MDTKEDMLSKLKMTRELVFAFAVVVVLSVVMLLLAKGMVNLL